MFTYQVFDVEIERKVAPEALSWPGTATDDGSLGGNRSRADLRRLPWSEAKRVYDLEEELVARTESADVPEEAYELIVDELCEDRRATGGGSVALGILNRGD